MEIKNGIIFDKLCIYIKSTKSLILSDIHLGYEEALNKDGIMMPRMFFKHLFEKTKNLIKNFNPDKIILNGDIKHELGNISRTEWRETKKFFEMLREFTDNIIIIKGNHDNLIEPIAKKNNIETIKYIIENDILICHGDVVFDIKELEKESKSKINTIIIGHAHPAISIKGENRSETFKCFIKGKWNKKELIIMPSYNEITIGVDVLKENLPTPYLRTKDMKYKDINNFEVYIYGDEVLNFGKIKNIKKLI